MLTTAQVRQFDEDGFLLGPTVLNEQEVGVLRDELERVIRDRDNPSAKQPVLLHNMTRKADAMIWQIVNIWEASEPFRKLIEAPLVTQAIGQLSQSKQLRIWHDQIQFKPAGTGGQNDWHQDIPYWPSLRADNMITAWLALDDVDEENGCMSMVPGSHRWGDQIKFLHTLKGRAFDDLPPEFEGKAIRIQRAPVAAGQVHFHHGLTWHGSHANHSSRPRRAIALHYLTDKTRFSGKTTHPMAKFIESAEGEEIRGEHFPIVWSA
jgi:ectoine hydroxylase-related dioxygenase (phytanoyl-CoA dioxygenase family)